MDQFAAWKAGISPGTSPDLAFLAGVGLSLWRD